MKTNKLNAKFTIVQFQQQYVSSKKVSQIYIRERDIIKNNIFEIRNNIFYELS